MLVMMKELLHKIKCERTSLAISARAHSTMSLWDIQNRTCKINRDFHQSLIRQDDSDTLLYCLEIALLNAKAQITAR